MSENGEQPEPKYTPREMLALRILYELKGAVTAGTVEQTMLANNKRVKIDEDEFTEILELCVQKGGVKKVGDNGYQLTTHGKTDLGPWIERHLGSFD